MAALSEHMKIPTVYCMHLATTPITPIKHAHRNDLIIPISKPIYLPYNVGARLHYELLLLRNGGGGGRVPAAAYCAHMPYYYFLCGLLRRVRPLGGTSTMKLINLQ